MFSSRLTLVAVFAAVIVIGAFEPAETADVVSRPEKVQSLRIVGYGRDEYEELAKRWKEYNDAFPSEDAYGYWMYAARYAKDPDYIKLLDKGLDKYPANPILLYLAGLKRLGAVDDHEGLQYLERSVAMDPTFMEPWFSLVIHYMQRGEMELMDVALRRLVEGDAISETVMDYCYNMLAGLHENAIIVTNGDNDTYPVWIFKRLMNHRPDVCIVNRSLLNSEWYPLLIIKRGAPRFITSGELEKLRTTSKPPWSDELIVRLIKAAEREERPVYIAATVPPSKTLKPYMESGTLLGLATLVSDPPVSLSDEVKRIAEIWLKEYRTNGLDSWSIRYKTENHSDRRIAINYASSLRRMCEPLEKHAPTYRLGLFNWYHNHVADIMSQKYNDDLNTVWCSFTDIPEIRSWCREKGYIE